MFNEMFRVVVASLETQNMCITFIQCWTNFEDFGPTLYEYYTNVLYVLGGHVFYIYILHK